MKKFMSLVFSGTLALTLGAQFAAAHGEDKPGPNGGFIRMPGAFHTEAIVMEASKLKVYLLDLNWKNPVVKDSSLKVTHTESKSSQTCKAESNFFVCQFPKNVDLNKKGELVVEANRANQKGMPAKYELPMKLQAAMQMPSQKESKKVDDGHAHH